MRSDTMNKVQRSTLILKQLSESYPRRQSRDVLMHTLQLDSENPTDKKNFFRLIHSLREIGYPIVNDDEYGGYYLDARRMIELSVNGYDLTLLKAAIMQAYDASNQLSPVLENALSKLHASGTSGTSKPPFSAEIPKEELLLTVIGAIENSTQLRFHYRGIHHSDYVVRDFRPHFVFAAARAFYVCGLARPAVETGETSDTGDNEDILSLDDLAGPSDEEMLILEETFDSKGLQESRWQWRSYKISRIDPDSVHKTGRFTAEDSTVARENLSSFFTENTATFAIRPDKAQGLRMLATPLAHCEGAPQGWECYQLDNVEKRFIFERLMTYGKDVILLGGPQLRREWIERLAHLSTVGTVSHD